MFRRPTTWIALTVICVVAGVLAYLWFPAAFPVLSLDIQMDRESARDRARELADRHGWGPEVYRQAASFGKDSLVQEFIELEGGGPDRFREVLAEGTFRPYHWEVRHFAEQERHEARIRFTPDGEFHGFREILPEDEPGAALAADEARGIAERAAGDHGVDLSIWQHVESSEETRPAGRVDHTFVYQRPDVDLGDGRLRLRLVVGGDRLVELTRYLEVPEAFERRFEEMRSDNWLINTLASAAMFLGLLGGAVVGLFLLYRRGWVRWRTAVAWAIFVAVLQGLAQLNQLPLAWMNYDTALSSQNFLLQQVGGAIASTVLLGLLFAITFTAAESLDRRAFPDHVRLWKLWSPGVANTPTVAGQTMGGYLLLGLFFGYEVLMYLVAHRLLGWWTPSSELVQPDVLATYAPWLQAIAVSTQAGFWEECLFRAVPLAGAALIGERYGNKLAWIGGALVGQAVIFGAGHAAYPTQPAYARPVELFLVAVGFGLLYLAFGLLPAVVLHFAYDVTWFALPLFASSAPGIWIDRAMVLLLVLVPLWVVLARWLRAGRWDEVREEHLNRSWRPAEAEEAEPERETAPVRRLGRTARRVAAAVGLVGLGLWAGLTQFDSPAPALEVGRDAAEAAAREALGERRVDLTPEWRTLSRVRATPDAEHRFVRAEGGEEVYRRLVGSYLAPPHWLVRFARFEGDVAERAEEYRVHVGPDGTVRRFHHRLPEARPGADLEETAARGIAEEALRIAGNDPVALRELSAVSAKRPERRDWTFTYEDPDALPLETGEARIEVEVAGDRVVDLHRFVHVPEDWERRDRNRRVVPRILGLVGTLILGLTFVAGVIAAAVGWSRGRLSVRAMAAAGGGVLALSVLGLANQWPATMAGFSTSEPLGTQTAIMLAGSSIGLLISAAALGVLVGWLHRLLQQRPRGTASPWEAIGLGAALGGLAAGVLALLEAAGSWLGAVPEPSWPSYGGADAAFPAVAAATGPLVGMIAAVVLFQLVFVAIDIRTGGWSRRTRSGTALVALLGLALAGAGAEGLWSWIVGAAVVTAALLWAYRTLLVSDLTLLPVAVGVTAILTQARQASLAAYPGSWPGRLLAVALIGAIAVLWTRALRADEDTG